MGIFSNIIGFHDISVPAPTSGSNIGTKIAYTRDGQNFVSKERVEENIKYSYARPGDYREVQVPLSAVVVGASIIPEGISEQDDKVATTTQTSQNKRALASEIKNSAQDKEWINTVLTTNAVISQEFEILSRAASNYQFDEIQSHSNSLMSIADNALETSKSYEVSPQQELSKNSYEIAMQEFYNGCNEVLDGIDTKDANMMYEGKDLIISGKNNLDKAINSLQQ